MTHSATFEEMWVRKAPEVSNDHRKCELAAWCKIIHHSPGNIRTLIVKKKKSQLHM